MASSQKWWTATLTTTALVLFVGVRTVDSIFCWDCNSAFDPRCKDKFNNISIAYTDCSQRSLDHLGDLTATFCRKTIQQVGEEERVIRGCGWLNLSAEDQALQLSGSTCFKRAGSAGTFVTRCNCATDGCNAGPGLQSTISAVLFGAFVTVGPLITLSHL